jgi:hypothetical protein
MVFFNSSYRETPKNVKKNKSRQVGGSVGGVCRVFFAGLAKKLGFPLFFYRVLFAPLITTRSKNAMIKTEHKHRRKPDSNPYQCESIKSIR